MLRAVLVRRIPSGLVDELLAAYAEAKKHLRLGSFRLSAVEGGRFCEAAFRVLEHIVWGEATNIGVHVDTEDLIRRLAQVRVAAQPDAVRLLIPRALRVVYDIRNKRDAAHLADAVDPSLQDGSLVVSILDWVLAELVRLCDGDSTRTEQLVASIVRYDVPLIQEFDGHLKVLDPRLRAGETCLVLLYARAAAGATFEELRTWVPARMRTNLRRTLRQLDEKAHVYFDGTRYFLTESGTTEVQDGRLFDRRTSHVA